MPRSIQEILDHADQLAKRFEDYEPNPDDGRLVEEYLLERAVLERTRSERQILDAVTTTRAHECSPERVVEMDGSPVLLEVDRAGGARAVEHEAAPGQQLDDADGRWECRLSVDGLG